jgi:hypothetical protein
MKARQLISGAAYGPATLQVLGAAFDAAWAAIRHQYDGTDVGQVEAARMRLAHAVLAVATEHSDSVDQVQNAALQVMALAHRSHLCRGSNDSN